MCESVRTRAVIWTKSRFFWRFRIGFCQFRFCASPLVLRSRAVQRGKQFSLGPPNHLIASRTGTKIEQSANNSSKELRIFDEIGRRKYLAQSARHLPSPSDSALSDGTVHESLFSAVCVCVSVILIANQNSICTFCGHRRGRHRGDTATAPSDTTARKKIN